MRLSLSFCVFFFLPAFSAFSCTVVLAWEGDQVWAGNNEDWYKTDAKYWYEPAGKEKAYGALFFGFRGDGRVAQGGMNEEGLFFDGLYIDKVALKKETRQNRKAAPVHVFKHMLHRAATVEEALAYLDQYFIPFIKSAQIVIADRRGDYAVLNVNGVTRRRLERESFVVISNFPAEICTPPPGKYPDYEQACRLMENSTSVDQPLLTAVLETTCQKGAVKSVYSNVFNLTERVATNYYLFDYRRPHVIDLKEDLSAMTKPVYFEELFPGRQEAVGNE